MLSTEFRNPAFVQCSWLFTPLGICGVPAAMTDNIQIRRKPQQPSCVQKKRLDDSSLAARLVLIVPAENAGARVCAVTHRMTRDPKARLLLIGFELTTAAQCEGRRVQPCFVFNGFQVMAG